MTMTVGYRQRLVKMVFLVRTKRSLSSMRSFQEKTLWPGMLAKINGRFNGLTDYKVDVKLKVHQVEPGLFELYPKFMISGDTALSENEIEGEVDNLVDAIKAGLVFPASVTLEGYHYHRGAGQVEEWFQ